jgi:hypothetical protein
MKKRAIKIVKNTYPVTAICESCERTFVSRSEDATLADKEIRSAFDAHKCKLPDSSQNAPRR